MAAATPIKARPFGGRAVQRPKNSSPKLREWRVVLIRNRGQFLGYVEAPSVEAAELAGSGSTDALRVDGRYIATGSVDFYMKIFDRKDPVGREHVERPPPPTGPDLIWLKVALEVSQFQGLVAPNWQVASIKLLVKSIFAQAIPMVP